jgi:hypothetical protein
LSIASEILAAEGTLTMDSHTIVASLLFLMVLAVVGIVATRNVRDKAAQKDRASMPKAGAATFPPAEMSDADVRSRLKKIEGGGLWEPWLSVPPPSPAASTIGTGVVHGEPSAGATAPLQNTEESGREAH